MKTMLKLALVAAAAVAAAGAHAQDFPRQGQDRSPSWCPSPPAAYRPRGPATWPTPCASPWAASVVWTTRLA